jgi:hypothetical protein
LPVLALFAAVVSLLPAADPLTSLESSDTCGECHEDIYDMWRASAHARSMENSRFLASYRRTESRDSGSATECLRCHAPLAAVTGDRDLNKKITWEGVTCDFCHGIVWVDMTGGEPRHRVEIGPVKRGPIQQAESTGHEVAFSRLHKDSAICVPCHEYVSPDGTAVLTTYSEWKDSQAARRGETCQTCHMAATRANVVDPRIQRDPVAEVNLHRTPGGHSQEQLHKALKVTIAPERDGETLELTVRLKNRGAGHAVPTGMPGRRIQLVVRVDTYEGQSFEERRSYGKTFKDKQGRTVTDVADYFAGGVELEADSRIAVDEERVESFRFPLASRVAADVVVKLHYLHPVDGDDEQDAHITFFSERRLVGPVSPKKAS